MIIKYVSDYPKHKREHSIALRAPQVLPLTGDGKAASEWNHARYSKRQNAELRQRLVAARYREWHNATQTEREWNAYVERAAQRP